VTEILKQKGGSRPISPSCQGCRQRSLQARAAQLSTDLVQTRIILFAESGNVVPTPFLVVLVLWIVIIFASFSLFSDLNVTVFTCPSLFALSASGAIFLILELGKPFSGLMMISSEHLRHALAPPMNLWPAEQCRLANYVRDFEGMA